MNFAQMRRIVEHAHLTGEANFAVLMVLAFHANDEGRAWPSKPTIMREARVSERTADNVVARLSKAGYFTIERGGGSKNTNVYLLHVERGGEIEKAGKGSEPRSSCGVSESEETPFIAEKTPQDLRGLEEKPRSRNGVSDAEPRSRNGVNGAPYKEKYFYNNSEVNSGGVRAGVREGSSPPTPPPKTSPVTLALCDVCGLMLDTMTRRDREELNELLPWLREQAGTDAEAVATAVRARFAPEVWGKPAPPRLSQIKPNWKRMEMIVANRSTLAASSKSVSEVKPNGTHINSTGQINSTQQSDAERRDQRGREQVEYLSDIARRRAELEERKRRLAGTQPGGASPRLRGGAGAD